MDFDLSIAEGIIEADYKMYNLVVKRKIKIESKRIIPVKRKTEETDWLSEIEVEFMRRLEHATDYLNHCRRNNIYVRKGLFPKIKYRGNHIIEYELDDISKDISVFGDQPLWDPEFMEHPKIDQSDNLSCQNDDFTSSICSNNSPTLSKQAPACPSNRCEGLDDEDIEEIRKAIVKMKLEWELEAKRIEKNYEVDDFDSPIENKKKMVIQLISYKVDILANPISNYEIEPRLINQENQKLKIALKRLFIPILKLKKIWQPSFTKLPKSPNLIRSHLDSSSLKKEGRNSEFSDSGGPLKRKYPV